MKSKLFGRDREQAQVLELVGGATVGRGGSLRLHGQAGSGKSSLLAFAEAEALRIDSRFLTLRATGVVAETELAWAGLSALCWPLRDHLRDLPGSQAELLARVLEPSSNGQHPGNPEIVPVAVALLRLLSDNSSKRPTLLILDDLHWMDVPSRRALGFVARRVGDDAIAMIGSSRAPLIGEEIPWLRESKLEPLNVSSTKAMLESMGVLVELRVARRIQMACEGNPFALEQVGPLLSSAQRKGAEVLPELLLVGATVERQVGDRMRALPAATRFALTVLAAEVGVDRDTAVRALRSLGLEESDLRPASVVGLIVGLFADSPFTHPLFATAILRAATVDERRFAQCALADAHDVTDPRRYLLRAAATEIGKEDGPLADDLERVGLAQRQTGLGAAVACLTQAARLAEDDTDRVRRLRLAAEVAIDEGDLHTARERLSTAELLCDVPIERARIELLKARVAARSGIPVGRAVVGTNDDASGDGSVSQWHLEELAEEVRIIDPGLAAELLLEGSLPWLRIGRIDMSLPLTTAAIALVGSGESGGSGGSGGSGESSEAHRIMVANRVAVAHTANLLGARVHSDMSFVERDIGRVIAGEGVLIGGPFIADTIGRLLAFGHHNALIGPFLDRVIADGRATGTASALVLPLVDRVLLHFNVHYPSAAAAAYEAIDLATETDQVGLVVHARYMLPSCLAAMGDAAGLDRALEPLRARRTDTAAQLTIAASQAFLAHALGDPTQALVALAPIRDRGPETDPIVAWRHELAEALARTAQPHEARHQIEILEQSEWLDPGYRRGISARLRALLTDDVEQACTLVSVALTELDGHASLGAARCRLAMGTHFRRAGRHPEALAIVTIARARFVATGSAAWVRLCDTELLSLGAAKQPPISRADGLLTARELQVAQMIVSGATQRDAGSRLFVSDRTIEAHLRAIYRKLGVRTRGELAARALSDPTLGDISRLS